MSDEPEPRSNDAAPGRLSRVLLAITASLALLLGLGGGIGLASYLWAGGQLGGGIEAGGAIDRGPGEEQAQGPDIAGRCDERSCNYLLLGSDDRSGLTREERKQFGTNEDIGGEQRSDTIILVHTEPGREQAVILSFPRDLWVRIPGRGYDKINSAFAGGIGGNGPQRVAATVKDLTGLQIHHVMYVNLAGFQGVVDALGGVEMCFPTALYDPLAGLDLDAGCQELSGAEALGVVRTRHLAGDCNNPDFARIGRQQQFFRALLSKMLSPGSIAQLPDLVQAAAKNVEIDEGLSPIDLAYLAGQLNGISTGAADFRAVPGQSTLLTTDPRYPGGIAIVEMDPAAEEMFAALREGRQLGNIGKELEGVAISPANIPMAVFDKASGGPAQEALGVLEAGGFDVDPLLRPAGDLTTDAKGSAILFEKGDEDKVDVIGQYVTGMRTVQVAKGSLGELDAAVVVTSGYEPEPEGEGGPGGAPSAPAC